jgi:hypothetical protein
MMVMNDSIGQNKQDTLNPKPKDYLDWDFTKKGGVKGEYLGFAKLIVP